MYYFIFIDLLTVCLCLYLQYMPAAAAAPMQGTYIPQYTAVPASAITVEVRSKSSSLFTVLGFAFPLNVVKAPQGCYSLNTDLRVAQSPTQLGHQ